jgi:hypothetical protein
LGGENDENEIKIQMTENDIRGHFFDYKKLTEQSGLFIGIGGSGKSYTAIEMLKHLGFDDTCEGGISYGSSKPGEKPGLGWRKFLNCGLNDRISKPLDNQSHGKINLKLVKNKDGFASLYINGVLAYTAKKTRLGKNPTVKAVHSTYNPASPSTLNSYANASFTNIKVKISPDESGSYKLLPSQPISKKPWPNFKGYTESKDTNNVLETSLRR